jgi:hypothetical protein
MAYNSHHELMGPSWLSSDETCDAFEYGDMKIFKAE